MSEGRTLVINPVGGLANRMRFLAGGICLARRLNSDFKIVWNINWELGARMDDLFEIHPDLAGKIVYPPKWEYELLYSVPRKRNLFVSRHTARRYGCAIFAEDPLWYDEADTSNNAVMNRLNEGFSRSDSCYIQGGIECFPYDTNFLRELFLPVAEIQAEADKVLKKLESQFIGVHIRRTDNIQAIRGSKDDDFVNLINDRLQTNPSLKIYLATDDEATKRRFSDIFADRILTDPSPAVRGNTDGVRTAFKEMLLLASASEIIGSYYSSFSELAAQLGDTPLTICRTPNS